MQLHQSHSVKTWGGSADIKDYPALQTNLCKVWSHSCKGFPVRHPKKNENFKLTLTSEHDNSQIIQGTLACKDAGSVISLQKTDQSAASSL